MCVGASGKIGDPPKVATIAKRLSGGGQARCGRCAEKFASFQGVASNSGRLRHDVEDRFAVIDLEPLLSGNVEPFGVEAHQMKHRGVEVRDVVALFDGMESELVGSPVNDAALQAAARHPDGKAIRM